MPILLISDVTASGQLEQELILRHFISLPVGLYINVLLK